MMADNKHIRTSSTESNHALFQHIADVIQQAHSQVRQTVNVAMLQSYWQIGRLIVEHEQQGNERVAYGKRQLQLLSGQLTKTFGKGFDASNLRQFYHCFPNFDAVNHNLSWTHYRTLIRIENPKSRAWYQQEAIDQNWSVRALNRQISKLKCFLLLDLKLGKLTHQDVGQMDTYVRIYDQHQCAADDNPTIGLILCSQKSEAVVKYSVLTDNKQLFSAKYLPYLPTEAELKQDLEIERMKIQPTLKTDAQV
ncbi:MAG: PDDEXK nuclease domain-containing protein [Mariprofundaceae bacterium]|nr:PDDEXK nuclease domain-containing protein [Mariprofundaceae bacterium]